MSRNIVRYRDYVRSPGGILVQQWFRRKLTLEELRSRRRPRPPLYRSVAWKMGFKPANYQGHLFYENIKRIDEVI